MLCDLITPVNNSSKEANICPRTHVLRAEVKAVVTWFVDQSYFIMLCDPLSSWNVPSEAACSATSAKGSHTHSGTSANCPGHAQGMCTQGKPRFHSLTPVHTYLFAMHTCMQQGDCSSLNAGQQRSM